MRPTAYRIARYLLALHELEVHGLMKLDLDLDILGLEEVVEEGRRYGFIDKLSQEEIVEASVAVFKEDCDSKAHPGTLFK